MTDPDPAAPRRRFTPGDLTSALALLISVFALAVALFEANTQRVQQRASVWPFVSVNQGFNAQGYDIEIANKGVGPARIAWMEMRYRGVVYEDLDSLIIGVLGEEDAFSYDVYRFSPVQGVVMSPGEVLQMFAIPWEENPGEGRSARTLQLAQRFSTAGEIELCYCSIFDECWTKRLGETTEPEPVRACPVP